jgi:hypothetical protein
MTSRTKKVEEELGMGEDPLGRDPILETLYAPSMPERDAKPRGRPRGKRTKDRKPLPEGQTYRLVTFSFYEDDVARLDALLDDARKRGHRKVSRSQIVRLALRQVKLDKMPEMI